MLASHIPAWKRLGLKLKYANGDAPTTVKEVNNESINLKRKPQSDAGDVDTQRHLTKKSRTNGKVELPERLSSPQPEQRESKKSVSFASDTKETDGDTAQPIQLDIPGSPGSTPKSSRREKRPKSERKSTASSTLLLPRKSRDALEYLSQHFHSQANWKFNKNREIWILKHVFSTQDIPIEYNASLVGYVHGLKSSGARERLIKDCQQSLNTSEGLTDASRNLEQDEAMTSRLIDDLKKEDLRQALSDDETYVSWIKQQPRARLILGSLDQLSAVDGGLSKVYPRVKKSKARTSRVEIESDTDSDTESGSDSDSDSNSNLSTGRDMGSNTPGNDKHDTSSSGTSSSGSESAADSSDSTSSSDTDSDSD